MAARRRGTAWPEEETLTLLSIWEENEIEEQLENPKTNNTSIYKTISSEMTDKGYKRTPEQCKVRMHTLKRSYRQCKGNTKESGKGRKTCKYFEKLDAILGTRPASSPVKVIESGIRKRCADFSSSSEKSSDEVQEIKQASEEQSAEKGDKNEDLTMDAMHPLTEETAKEITLTGDKKEQEIASKANDPKPQKKKESTVKKDGKGKKAKKSRLEVALGAVMEGFSTTNEKSEDKFLEFEKNKLEIEKKKLN
ncbi:zinc finger and SCAN domain-containing protein 29-like [Saccostrea echinata]|uniref:zinc finger and SCAN domain-containing protein 29-like n=1 Tax=Saccostrea echinata TaxID=191078 RepID=UPI002A7F5DA4|nr:zinc finger and SCAN domain-containing protein 29-like [Saccostrea echinata]